MTRSISEILKGMCRAIQNKNNDKKKFGFVLSPRIRATSETNEIRCDLCVCVTLSVSLFAFKMSLYRQFQYILDDASKKPLGPGLGSLTSENRTVWAEVSCI